MATKTRSELKTNVIAGNDILASDLSDTIDACLNLSDDSSLIPTLEDAIYKDLTSVNAGLTGIKLGRRKYGNSNGGAYSYWFEGTITTNTSSADTHTLTLDDGTTFGEIKTYQGSTPINAQAFIKNSSGDVTGTFDVDLSASGIIANFGTSGLTLDSGDTLGLNMFANLGVE